MMIDGEKVLIFYVETFPLPLFLSYLLAYLPKVTYHLLIRFVTCISWVETWDRFFLGRSNDSLQFF